MRGRILRAAILVALAAGVTLGVLGLQKYSAASDDEKRTKEIAALRRELRGRVRAVAQIEDRLDSLVIKLYDELRVARTSINHTIRWQRLLDDGISEGTTLWNAGNESAARAQFETLIDEIVKMQEAIDAERAAVLRTHAALAELEAAEFE